MNLAAYVSQASAYAVSIDRLFYILLAMAGTASLLVFGMVVVFGIRYRRGSSAKRGPLPKFLQSEIELGWTAATLFLFLFVFWWAASSQLSALTPPQHATEIHVVAKQWMWKVQQPSGVREIDELHAPMGTPVRLVMTSEDVIHSLFLPALRIKQDVLPGRYTYLWFTADKAGVYGLECAEFCGTQHAGMNGRIVIQSAEEYSRWSSLEAPPVGPSREGEALFRSLGCSGCHAPAASVHAPDLAGLFGRTVHLSDGRQLIADAAYVRDSILLPNRDVVAGFAPIMPSYQGQVNEEQMIRLLAYLKSLSAAQGTRP